MTTLHAMPSTAGKKYATQKTKYYVEETMILVNFYTTSTNT
jgi:hypothetical protein